MAAGRREVVFRVHRYSPEGRRWVQEYRVPLLRGMTVLDALLYIKSRLDPTLAMRYSCRMGTCGSCGVLVNGVPRLACQTQVRDVAGERGVVEVAPLPGYPVIRDLIVDNTRMLEAHRSIKPYILRRSEDVDRDGLREFQLYPSQLLRFYPYTLCIMCGLCNAACPVYAASKSYLGPMVLTWVYRFLADPRDEAARERIAQVSSPDGCFGCRFAASCSAVCPKAVDPAGAIQRLRSAALRAAIGLFRKRTVGLAGPLEKPLRRVEARYPTENLVEGADPEREASTPPPSLIDPESPP